MAMNQYVYIVVLTHDPDNMYPIYDGSGDGHSYPYIPTEIIGTFNNHAKAKDCLWQTIHTRGFKKETKSNIKNEYPLHGVEEMFVLGNNEDGKIYQCPLKGEVQYDEGEWNKLICIYRNTLQ